MKHLAYLKTYQDELHPVNRHFGSSPVSLELNIKNMVSVPPLFSKVSNCLFVVKVKETMRNGTSKTLVLWLVAKSLNLVTHNKNKSIYQMTLFTRLSGIATS